MESESIVFKIYFEFASISKNRSSNFLGFTVLVNTMTFFPTQDIDIEQETELFRSEPDDHDSHEVVFNELVYVYSMVLV